DKYTLELNRHAQACAWLKKADASVDLWHVPEVEAAPSAQMEAFPQVKPPAFPACYESASPPGEHRETLKELYRTKDDGFLDAAFTHLLDVLEAGQSNPPRFEIEVPWGFKEHGRPLNLDRIKGVILETLEDLESYGASLCPAHPNEWESRRNK